MLEPALTDIVAMNRSRVACHEIRGLLLAVEVLSPGSARAERQVKRRLYRREAVPEYWILDLDAPVIERWRPDDDRPGIVETLLE